MIPGRDDLQLVDRTMAIAWTTTKKKKNSEGVKVPRPEDHYLLQARLLASVVSPTAEEPNLVASSGTCSTPRPLFC